LHTACIPVSPAARGLKDRRSALHHALCDGEDFELLFTVPPRREQAFISAWRRRFTLSCARIGEMTRRKGVIECIDAKGVASVLKSTGYQHFV
jgi:thiamine-monophosphate kinase